MLESQSDRMNGRPAALLDRWQWIIVAVACVAAVWLRVAPRFYLVFQPGWVNFQETDAWYHVRVMDNLIRHFPWRISVDPYVAFGRVQATATAPAFDWLLGFAAWVAGAGSPSESLAHQVAAWMPVLLGAGAVIVGFLWARLVFGVRAALVSAAIIATLPGHFLRVSSLGFTDHHILESVLAALFFYLLLRAISGPESLARSIAAGLALSAYLLTFHGSAFLPGVVVVWAAYDRLRCFWPRENTPSWKPLYVSFAIALCVCLVFRRLLWMNYTIATLAGGMALIVALDGWRLWSRRLARPRIPVYVMLSTVSAAFLTGVLWVPAVRHGARMAAGRLLPGIFGASRGVSELRSLIYVDGHFTVLPAMLQFYGTFFVALLGLLFLAEVTVKRGNYDRALVFFWGGATFVLAMGQMRMAYYYAVAAAIVSGYAVDLLLAMGRKTAWVTVACLCALVLGPNCYAAWDSDEPTGINADWKETLDWLHVSTPEPFGDPAFYYARYDERKFGPSYRYPPEAYSVMAWWDYGYWVVTVARRIPVTNPSQTNAEIAADFFLAQSEAEAAPLLRASRSRYIVVDEKLPIWPSDNLVVGDYPQFFEYSRAHERDEYLLPAYRTGAQGQRKLKVFYRPAYYRSMAVRLFVYGGQAVDGHGGATIISLQEKTRPKGGSYQEVVSAKRYESAEEAMAVENVCRKDGCVLVGEDPMTSCVPLEPLQQLRPAFASTNRTVGFGSAGRKAVQVYEFTGVAR